MSNEPDFETVCVTCGGRGGWWTGDRRDFCPRCNRTGWEPSESVRRVIHDADGAA